MSDVVLSALMVVGIFFVAVFVRSIFGFGDALIAMPLLSLTVGIGVATPLVGLITLAIAVVMLLREQAAIDIRAGWSLILSTMIGIPIGVMLIRAVPEMVVKVPLGLLLIGYGLYHLLRPTLPQINKNQHTVWAWGLGFVAGILGGAYNTNGPPIVIYGTLRRWPPQQFRATLQFYFLITGIVIAAGQGLAGLWTRNVLWLSAISLPVIVAANLLGHVISQRIRPEAYVKLVFALIVVIGVLFLL
ncbi:MAG: TSUP family transporter [Chloroflexi bacterium]|nr:TSUP family transporter [Chloroflexota bacterium]